MQDMFEAATRMGLLTTDELLSFASQTRKKPMSDFQFLKNKFGNDSSAMLREWFSSGAGCHDASCGDEKGDLLRWKNTGDAREPTIRRDMMEAVLAGKVVVKGDQDLMDFIIARL
jgi:hypothetical protein